MCFPLRVIGKAKYVADHFAAPCITVSVTAAPTAELCYYKKYVSHVAFYAPPLYTVSFTFIFYKSYLNIFSEL